MTRFNGTSCFHTPCSYLGSSYHTKGLVGPLQELSDPDLEAVLFIGMSSKHSTGPDIQQIFNMFVEWRNNLCCESHPFNGLFQWYMLVKVWGLVLFWSPLQFTPFPGHFAEVFVSGVSGVWWHLISVFERKNEWMNQWESQKACQATELTRQPFAYQWWWEVFFLLKGSMNICKILSQ